MRWIAAIFAFVLLPSSAFARWPALAEVMDRARASSVPAVDAEGQLAVARATRSGAAVSWLTNPYLEFQGWKSNGTKDFAFQSFAMIPIEINGQRPARMREADALEKWKSVSREETRARVAGYAVTLYGDALVARARLELATKAESDAKSEADLYAARLAAGDATAVDLNLADAELARWSQQRAEATLALMTARDDLAGLIALPDLSDPPLGADPPPLRAPTAEAFAMRAQDNAPQVRAMASEASFFRAQSDRASRDKNAPLSFIVNFGRSDLGDFQFGGGLAWTFPITWRAQGPVAVADASAERADAMRASTQHLIATRAKGLYEQYELVRTTLASLDKTAIPAQERLVDATVGAYRSGKSDFVRVLQARRDLAQARARRLDLVLAAWHRLGEMTALTGDLP